MATHWKQYQQHSAEFFQRLGLSAKVGLNLDGARSTHNVDVFVEGSLYGIAFKWVIECKDWATSVPKEKVMALSAIVQDLGADRGLLLSETGFQSGAVRAARLMNITLSSLEDLTATTEDSLLDSTIGALHWRLRKAQSRLHKIRKEQFDEDYFPPMMREMGSVFVLEQALQEALDRRYPIVYGFGDNDVRKSADNFQELLKAANEIITQAENWNPRPSN